MMDKVLLELRAGEGGTDSKLFIKDMASMYEAYCNKSNLSFEQLDQTDSFISYLISGRGCKAKFRLESGIHRVQRVPPTETKGRRHTSTIAVAVLPYTEVSEVEILESDLKVEFTKGSGPGGQHRNKVETAVRITHIPTGIQAYSATKSQKRNRELALAVLRSRLQEIQTQSCTQNTNKLRTTQIRDMGRGTRVRTYNFIEDRVKDERTSKKFKTKHIMSGNLELIYREV
jgi:peptide chain release factor 1